MAGQTELQLPARKSSAFSICRGIQERRYTLCLRKSLLSPQRPLLPKLLRQSRRSARLPIPHSAAAAPPLTPEVYVEFGTNQYNITDVVERAKADYRTTHKVGVQSCKVYVKPEEGAAYYVINKVSGKLEL